MRTVHKVGRYHWQPFPGGVADSASIDRTMARPRSTTADRVLAARRSWCCLSLLLALRWATGPFRELLPSKEDARAGVRPHVQSQHPCARSAAALLSQRPYRPNPQGLPVGGSRVPLHSRSELALDAPAGSPDHWASGAVLQRSVRALLKDFARADSRAGALPGLWGHLGRRCLTATSRTATSHGLAR